MALLPQSFLNAVISIGLRDKEGKFESFATGFLVGFFTGEISKDKKKSYGIWLVTNRHVFEGKREVWLRFNITEVGSKVYLLELENKEGQKIWSAHPNPKVDVATIRINVEKLKEDNIQFSFFRDDKQMAFRDIIKQEGITQGDGIFVLGFPMGIAGEEKNYVIVRSGVISRLDDEIINNNFEFLIDCTIFPGNSGGPVILKPEVASITGTKAVSRAYLLGVVRNYILYEDVAVSTQTKKPRVVFVENSGLAGVVPLDFVKELIEKELTTAKEME